MYVIITCLHEKSLWCIMFSGIAYKGLRLSFPIRNPHFSVWGNFTSFSSFPPWTWVSSDCKQFPFCQFSTVKLSLIYISTVSRLNFQNYLSFRHKFLRCLTLRNYLMTNETTDMLEFPWSLSKKICLRSWSVMWPGKAWPSD